MKEKEKTRQLVESFMYAEELVREEGEKHRELMRLGNQGSMSQMAHESMINSMSLLDSAFEALLSRTYLRKNKIRYAS